MDSETAQLRMDLRWECDGRRYACVAVCLPGLTTIHGAGASSLLALLAGHPMVCAGAATLDGRPLRNGRAAARYGPQTRPVAAMLQGVAIALWRTPLGAVTASARTLGVPYPGARRRAARALDWVGATNVAHVPCFRLGEAARERVRLATALVQVPGLLLLDRPFEPLAVDQQRALWDTVARHTTTWESVVLATGSTVPQSGRSIQVLNLD